MAGIDFKVIFEDGGGATSASGSSESAATADTAELPLPPKSRWRLPKKMEPVTSEGSGPPSKKSADSPELADALKGLGKFAAGQAGFGHVVGTLENLTKHLSNVYQATLRSPAGSATDARPRVRLPDSAATETKLPDASRTYQSIYGNLPSPTQRGFTLPPPVATGANPVSSVATAGGTAGGQQAVTAAAGQATAALARTAAALAANPIGAALLAGAAAATAFAAAAALAAYGVTKAVNILHAEGDRLQDYSGELASSFAQSDVRAMLADMRRAQKIGPDVAKVEDIRSRVLEKISDINTEIYALLAKWIVKMEPAIDEIVGILGVTAESVPHIADMIRTSFEAFTMQWGKVYEVTEDEAKNIERMTKAIKGYIEGKNEEKSDYMDPLLAAFMGGFARGPDDLRGVPPKDVPTLLPWKKELPAGGRGTGGAAGGWGM